MTHVFSFLPVLGRASARRGAAGQASRLAAPLAGRRRALAAVLGLSLAVGALPWAQAQEPLRVVASFSILADMVREVGGDRVAVDVLVPAGGDAHAFEPTPKDARRLGGAQVLVYNGLDFEGWLPRLLSASGFKGRQVEAARGVALRRLTESELGHSHGSHDHDSHGQAQSRGHDHHAGDHDQRRGPAHSHGHGHDHSHGHSHDRGHSHDHGHGSPAPAPKAVSHAHAHAHAAGDVDPHAWQDLSNGQTYVRNIAEGLAQADPAHGADYRARAEAYSARIAALHQALKADFAELPAARRKVVTSHDAFGYFGQAYGLEFLSLVGLSSAAEPSAAAVAALTGRIRQEGISALFVEHAVSPRLIEQLARETGVRQGGMLYADTLAQSGEAASYLGMFRWNAAQLKKALTP